MKIIQLIIWFMMVTGAVMAQEVVTKLDVVGQGIINEELRRTRSSTSANGASIISIQADLASKFTGGVLNVANGGTGTDDTGATSSTFLRGDSTWVALPKTACDVFTSPGTTAWIAPSGVNAVKVTMVGGGGGGGSSHCSSDHSGCGGGGGAAIIDYISLVTPGSSYNVVVGTGGTASANTCNQSVRNGSASTFNGLSAAGGTGGSSQCITGALGGVGANTFKAGDASISTAGTKTNPSWSGGNGGVYGVGVEAGGGGGSYLAPGGIANTSGVYGSGGGGGTYPNGGPAGGDGVVMLCY